MNSNHLVLNIVQYETMALKCVIIPLDGISDKTPG